MCSGSYVTSWAAKVIKPGWGSLQLMPMTLSKPLPFYPVLTSLWSQCHGSIVTVPNLLHFSCLTPPAPAILITLLHHQFYRSPKPPQWELSCSLFLVVWNIWVILQLHFPFLLGTVFLLAHSSGSMVELHYFLSHLCSHLCAIYRIEMVVNIYVSHNFLAYMLIMERNGYTVLVKVRATWKHICLQINANVGNSSL
jgi:hypothetical protein